tara:strand:+ start:1626 stop:2057 length:432 start_codon:yes stop_codon:yes gene_type:complete
MIPVTLTVTNPEDSRVLVEALIPMMNDYQVFCFHGELGAGKTTYIKALCKEIAIESETSSPSFSIVNEYERKNKKTLFHFDLYRLNKQEELVDIGWYDYLNSNNLMLIEWPEMAGSLIPSDAVHVNITKSSDQSRIVTINPPS